MTKISILLIGAIIFVILGVLFTITPDTFVSLFFRSPQNIRIIGVSAIIFFGVVGIYGLRKLFDQSIGLTIDDNGITDNSNASSTGLIEWGDIIEVKTERLLSTRFLSIFVSNPEKYLERVNGFKRMLMKGNMKMYGTPLSIASSTLKYNLDELESLIKKRLKEKREKIL